MRGGRNATIAKDQDDGAVLNDVNIIMHISADRKRVDMVSVPRDTMVDLPACEQPDGQMRRPNGYFGQINWAFGQGGGGEDQPEYGIACVIKTLEETTGVYFDGYIMVDFRGFVDMVDALGGVDMCIEERFKGQDLYIELEPGMHNLDGRTALRYARTRKGWSGNERLTGSDTDRISRQQQLIAAVAHKVLSERSLGSLPRLNEFAVALTRSLITSPELASVQALGGLAFALRNIDMAHISLLTTPVVTYPQDHNRLQFDQAGYSNTMGLTAAQLFDLIATDQLIPGTVPYKAVHPDPSPSTGPDIATGSPGATQGPLSTPEPDEGVSTAFNAPVTCNP
jgi:LCP family protein required for cell wall assembly